jgi:hypothetical protein
LIGRSPQKWELEEALRLDPSHPLALALQLATALARSSRCEEAVRVEERAVELTVEHASSALRGKLLARLDARGLRRSAPGRRMKEAGKA